MSRQNKKENKIDLNGVIRHVVSSEKTLRLMEAENILAFVVDKRADKIMIREAIETQFKTRVGKVRTLINRKGEKVAYVKFAETPAIDIATNLGMV